MFDQTMDFNILLSGIMKSYKCLGCKTHPYTLYNDRYKMLICNQKYVA